MYDYTEEKGSDDPFFYFETINNLTYYVAFRNISTEKYPLNNVYSLDFGELNQNKASEDSEVSTTILKIITDFIAEDENRVIHFLYDIMDERQLCRKRLFNRWFSKCHLEDWIKYDYNFENIEEYNISFIYKSSVYDTNLIQSEILLTLDVYERAKSD